MIIICFKHIYFYPKYLITLVIFKRIVDILKLLSNNY